MGFSSTLLLILTILVGIYSFVLLSLNKSIVHLDLLFLELDLQLGYVILWSALFGILTTAVLELIFFSTKSKKDE